MEFGPREVDTATFEKLGLSIEKGGNSTRSVVQVSYGFKSPANLPIPEEITINGNVYSDKQVQADAHLASIFAYTKLRDGSHSYNTHQSIGHMRGVGHPLIKYLSGVMEQIKGEFDAKINSENRDMNLNANTEHRSLKNQEMLKELRWKIALELTPEELAVYMDRLSWPERYEVRQKVNMRRHNLKTTPFHDININAPARIWEGDLLISPPDLYTTEAFARVGGEIISLSRHSEYPKRMRLQIIVDDPKLAKEKGYTFKTKYYEEPLMPFRD